MKALTKKERKLLSSQKQINIENKKREDRKIKPGQSNKFSVVAIDTNMFIDLAKINENAISQNPGLMDAIRDVKRLSVAGHIKFVILPSVVEEIFLKLNKREKEFLEKYCYIIDVSSIKNFEENCTELAQDLVSYELVKNKKNAPIFPLPIEDAIIVSQAIALDLSLLTSNVKDLINYDKYSQIKGEAKRAQAIENYGKLYFKKLGVEIDSTSKPLTSQQFLSSFKNVEYKTSYELIPATIDNIIKHVSEEHRMFESREELNID